MRKIARFFAGPVMTLAGINHFVMPGTYERIIPAGLPAPRMLVYVSGVVEIVGALGTMHPRTRRRAGWLLVATLVAVFPANVYMALNADDFPGVPGGQAALIVRLPLQVLFIYWVWVATMGPGEVEPPEAALASR
ncbi:MAG: DoxX family membrane protein [Actinobacteria bacterium]|nr:DoxX family membrane protein [Actinomycetota bacterium]